MSPSLDIVSITEFCSKYKVSKRTIKLFDLENPVGVEVITPELYEQKVEELLRTRRVEEPAAKRPKYEILASEDDVDGMKGDEITLVTDLPSSYILESSDANFNGTTNINILYTSEVGMMVKSSSPPLPTKD